MSRISKIILLILVDLFMLLEYGCDSSKFEKILTVLEVREDLKCQ